MPQPEKRDRDVDRKGKSSPVRARWIWIVRLAALGILLLLLMPHGIRWGVNNWLTAHGALEARIENVDFNPFTGRLALFGLTVRGAEDDGLSGDRFEIDIDWLPLLKKRLHLAGLEVEGLDFDLRRLESDQWLLGGILLPAGEKEQSDWQWGIAEAHLSDVDVDLHEAKIDERFGIERLRLEDMYGWEADGATPFHLEMKAFDGELLFEGRARPFSRPMSVEGTLQVEEMALKALEPFIETPIEGELSLDFEVKAQKGDETRPLQLETDGKISVADFLIETGELHLSGKTLDWTGIFRLAGGEDDQWALEGDLEAEAVKLDDPAKGLNMVQAAGLSVKGGLVEQGDVTIGRALLSGIGAFERPGGAEGRRAPGEEDTGTPGQSAHLLTARQLALGPMRFDDEVQRFEKGVFEGVEILLVRRPEAGMELTSWLEDDDEGAGDGAEDGAEESQPQQPNDGNDAGSGPHLQIVDLQFNEARVLFVDRAVSPTVRLEARPMQLRIQNLDRGAPEKDISVVLDSKIEEYATLHLEGTVRPFGEALDMELTGTIDSFNLPGLSPYAARHLDYRLRQGHLDAALDWRIKNWQLEAQNEVKISKLQVEALKDDEESKLSDVLGLRASTALSLLRDRQNNIEIDLPLSGDLRDPDFEFDGVIVKAVRNAVQKTAVFYYAPLGLSLLTGVPLPPGSFTIAGRVIDWATSVRFDPVSFAPGSSELDEKGRAYIEKLVSTLKDKEDLRIVICGRSAPADLGEEQTPEKPWSEETRRALIDLARERSLAVKKALVDAGIADDRLFLCQPQLGEGDQVGSRVDIYL